MNYKFGTITSIKCAGTQTPERAAHSPPSDLFLTVLTE